MIEKPRGNASTDDWIDYATTKGVSPDDLKGKTRDDIRAMFPDEEEVAELKDGTDQQEAGKQVGVEADPNQEDNNPGQADDTTPPAEEGLSKFLSPQAMVEPAADPKATVQVPETGGNIVQIDKGEKTAVVVKGVCQFVDRDGYRHYARKGQTVQASEELISRGIRIGYLEAS